MKQLFSTKLEEYSLVGHVSDDRMKVFLSAEVVTPSVDKSSGAPSDSTAPKSVVAPQNAANPPAGTPSSANPSSVAAIPSPVPEPAARTPISRARLEELLGTHVPIALLHAGVLDDIAKSLARHEAVKERRVAKGTDPMPGQPGKLVFLVKRVISKPTKDEAKVQDEGASSLRDLHLFDNLKAGTVVARLYPPKPGTDGQDALGKKVPARAGEEVKPKIDKTIEIRPPQIEEPFSTLVAKVDGFLGDESGALTIQEILQVKGNVDFHVGNIDFVGGVSVKGDVLTGFFVRADKTITVFGSVQGGTIQSRAGDVLVKQFVFGGPEGKILCRGAFSCQTAREARAEALGNITVTKEAYQCTFRTQGALMAENAKVIGGHTFAVCGVDAQQLGNDAGLPTTIELCSDIEMSTEYSGLEASIASHQRAVALLELHLGPYAKTTARVSLLEPTYRQKIEALLKKRNDIKASLIELLAQQRRLLEGASSAQTLRVNVRKILYPGVTIRAGGEVFSVQDPLKGPCSIDFLVNEKKFIKGELKGLECVLVASPRSVEPEKRLPR